MQNVMRTPNPNIARRDDSDGSHDRRLDVPALADLHWRMRTLSKLRIAKMISTKMDGRRSRQTNTFDFRKDQIHAKNRV